MTHACMVLVADLNNLSYSRSVLFSIISTRGLQLSKNIKILCENILKDRKQ